MTAPRLHWEVKRDVDTGEVQTRCGKWLMNPRMQIAHRREDVTCPRCMRKEDDPRYEDYAKEAAEEKAAEHRREWSEEAKQSRGDED